MCEAAGLGLLSGPLGLVRMTRLTLVLLSAGRAVAVAVIVAVLLALAWVAMHSSPQTWGDRGGAESGEYGMIFVLAAATTLPLGVLASIGRARWRRNED